MSIFLSLQIQNLFEKIFFSNTVGSFDFHAPFPILEILANKDEISKRSKGSENSKKKFPKIWLFRKHKFSPDIH